MSAGPTHPEPIHHAPIALLRTPLYDHHVALGGHMVPFNGWEMPLYFDSILKEHVAVRTGVGWFDVSHMGILTVRGGHSAELLSRRTTANIALLSPGHCRYTFLLESTGSILDDLIITRLDAATESPSSFLAVPNAGRAPAIFDLLRQHRRPDTTIARENGRVAILAVQGPKAPALLAATFGWGSLGSLGVYQARLFPSRAGSPVPPEGRLAAEIPKDLADGILVSRTGYTGEAGFELFVRAEEAIAVVERLEAGGAVPCGLGARDTLRLEKGYLLSGQDFNRDRSPLEAAQERFVEFDHPFVGREPLESQQKEGVAARLAGIEVEAGAGIPRHGTPVLADGRPIAIVTSGGISPTLGKGIALAYLPKPWREPGQTLSLDLRGHPVSAKVVKLPFLRAAKAPGATVPP
ncbi:MAG: glycine cleavage system aminomethyltransferase GcvT [Thermoplasmata archaeon]|nr:glycine cleavage system aminomethyltransferase GcvT [Thermoplasmata archaeon]